MMSIRNNIIERKGVNAIDRVFTNMGWIFRENPHTDYGIDGDVEQVIDDELTGRHIALQIKSGDSYLKENKGGRITFYIDEWHYKYWLQYDRPVIILFYDEVNDKVIWDQVKLSKVTNTNTQFKIEINPDKILNDSVLPELNSIISSYTSHKFYELTNEFDNFEFSLFCYQELNRSIGDFCPELQHFKDVICAQGLNPNTGILITSIDHFRKKLQSSSQTDYELLHKGCWYLKTMANHIPFLLFETLRSKVREYISGPCDA